MNIKKITSALIAAAMLAGMTACGNKSDEVAVNNTAVTAEKAESKQAEDNEQSKLAGKADKADEDNLLNRDLENGQYMYNEYEKHIEITKYLLDAPAVEIPSEIDGKPVTVIGESTFVDYRSGLTIIGKNLKSVIIPNSVTEIGDKAFAGCSSLASINIPDSITEIGGWAFEGCSNLTSITIPDSVTEIGGHAFLRNTMA
ncbi:MAG: leucine-rich repeat domain-containing protein [Oscillospiraceae bacterium]|nr:leucine-rich repeat domain-containing protein [Oscillospiraceae bacterium]